jgi:hypothetical protein
MSTGSLHPIELLACPKCGSEWFVSSKCDERIVFQMDTDRHPVIARPDQQAKDATLIDPDHLYCGACTWKGSARDLVESHM